MNPTMKLRYVQRGWKNVVYYNNTDKEPIYILQQWWKSSFEEQWDENKPDGEWRDIPIEMES